MWEVDVVRVAATAAQQPRVLAAGYCLSQSEFHRALRIRRPAMVRVARPGAQERGWTKGRLHSRRLAPVGAAEAKRRSESAGGGAGTLELPGPACQGCALVSTKS